MLNGQKFTITVETDAEDLEDDALWDCEAAVKETLLEYGYECETISRRKS